MTYRSHILLAGISAFQYSKAEVNSAILERQLPTANSTLCVRLESCVVGDELLNDRHGTVIDHTRHLENIIGKSDHHEESAMIQLRVSSYTRTTLLV